MSGPAPSGTPAATHPAADTQALIERLLLLSEVARQAVLRGDVDTLDEALGAREGLLHEIGPRIGGLAAAAEGATAEAARQLADHLLEADARLEDALRAARDQLALEIEQMQHTRSAIATYSGRAAGPASPGWIG